MEEFEFSNPESRVLGWPYTSDQEFGAYHVEIKHEDQGLIVQVVLNKYVVLPAFQIFYMHNRSFPGIEGQEGYLIKDRRDLSYEVQVWWVPFRSGVTLNIHWDSLDLILLNPGQLRTGRLYRIVTTLDSVFYEVIYNDGRWNICSEMEEVETGALVVPTAYYIDSDILYPRVFVLYRGDMKMFAMRNTPKLVPDFRGRVPAYYTRLRTSESDQ